MEKKAKIIATLGPAIYNEAKLKQLVNLGVDTFRINFSHNTNGINKIVSKKTNQDSTSYNRFQAEDFVNAKSVRSIFHPCLDSLNSNSGDGVQPYFFCRCILKMGSFRSLVI